MREVREYGTMGIGMKWGLKFFFNSVLLLCALVEISACETTVTSASEIPTNNDPVDVVVPNKVDTFELEAAQAAVGSTHSLIEHSIRPSEADTRVIARDEVHRIAMMGSQTLHPGLVVFLAGTTDSATTSVDMMRYIAHGSTRAIGLSYSNATEVLGLCQGSADTACIGKSLTEMFDGVDHSPLITVPDQNSVETRLTKLLILMSQKYPAEGWQYYLDESNHPRWDHIIISGHSLGGYMAGIIAKLKKVQRSVGLASFGYSGDWILMPSLSDVNDCYTFAHTGDSAYPSYQVNWKRYGYPGVITSIDSGVIPAKTAQLITSLATPGTDPHHTVTIFNGKSPTNGDGTYIYAPVWDYLFDLSEQN